MSDDAAVRQAVESAVSEALRTADGAMLTRWVLLAEVIDGESGERAVWCLTPDAAKAWDVLGLLVYAQQIEQAGIVSDHLDGDDR